MKYGNLYNRVRKLKSPSMRREWIEIVRSVHSTDLALSPSMRREWIEMILKKNGEEREIVSLHAEGVD